ncbi:MAG: AAA family ATPase, partial [Gimesia sp.]
MKITRIHVDQFGNWKDLNLASLNAGINVFYGPNETGKSTLMRMIRGILYGFHPENTRTSSRVSDAVPWSGLLDIHHKGQHYEIRRQTNAKTNGHFSFQGESRGTSSKDLLTSLHAGVNENVYENVFAIGLNELQELGTLHGDQVAQHIYGLSLGPEGQTILDVSDRLSQSQQKLLSKDFKTGKLVDLYQRLDGVNTKLGDVKQQAQHFFNLSGDLQNLRSESDSLKKSKEGLQYQIRGHRFLDRVWRPWQEVQTLHHKLKQLPRVHDFPENGVAKLNEYDLDLKQVEGKLAELKAEIQRLGKEIERYESANDLLNFAPNIQSLADQKSWIADLEQQYQQGESKVRDLEQTLNKHLAQDLTLSQINHIQTTPDNNQRLISAARTYHFAFTKRKRAHLRYKKVSRKSQQTLVELQEQSSQLLNGNSIDEELKTARVRMKHLERLSQLRVRESEILIRQEAVKEQLSRLQTHARIPSWAKKTLFGFALAGLLLITAGAWRGVSDVSLIGLIYCLTGLFLGGLTWAIKKHFETDIDDQAEELQDDSWAFDVHLRETRQEIEGLLEDEYFSLKIISEGHSLTSHKHKNNIPALNFNDENILRTDLLHELALKISQLEQLKTAQERAQKTRHLLVKLRNRSQEIQRQFSSKRHDWCECLKQVGLTETLKTKEAFQMWHRFSNANLSANELDQEKRRIKPLNEIVNQFYQRVRDLGQRMDRNEHDFKKPFAVIAEWERELDKFSVHQQERTRLRKEEKKLRLESDAIQLKRQELKQKRSSLLIQGSSTTREEFLQQATSLEERILIDNLLEDAQIELEKISRTEQEMAIVEEDLLNFNPDENTERLEMLNLELEDIEQDLVTTAENMGRLKQDYQNAKSDRSSAHLRFEREQILEQIKQTSTKWFSNQLSETGLNQLRSKYERTCQPETLAMASEYLRQLTNEKYRNIWTPLGEQFPKIDDQQGNTLTVSELSSGTREQLFLAIRLAVVERFRKNGVELPMILDDVLVNFDQERTIAAIKTLNAVAEKGQQILFFTCHLHLSRLFEEHGGSPVMLQDVNAPTITSLASPRYTPEMEQSSDSNVPYETREFRRDNSHDSSLSLTPKIPPFYLNRLMPIES